jgi:putative heme-binding domain-containing protein
VAPRWKTASTARGHAIFQAAGCVTCHRVGNEGAAVGPDLTGFGDRGDATHAIRSMLEPDAAITEGFALVTVATTDGAAFAGILAEESDRVLTLTQPNAQRVTIEKSRIARRESLHRSIMPSFATVLAPEPMAELVAWLMSQRAQPGPGAEPRTAAPVKTGFSWEMKAERLVIAFAGERVADFVFQDAETLRPHFQNLTAPGGVQVTRQHPPVAPEATDHGALHPGLWFAFGDINGADFWRNKARIEHVAFSEPPAEREGRLSFATENRLVTMAGGQLGTQRLKFTLWRDSTALWIDCQTELRGHGGELSLGDQEEMGLGVRVTSGLTEKAGDGSVLNSAGLRGAKAAWSKVADWCEYAAPRGSRRVGVALFADPKNPQRSWWHTRDYGLMVANAFGARVLPAAAQGKVIVPAGASLRLHYVARFFNEPTDGAVAPAEVFRRLF